MTSARSLDDILSHSQLQDAIVSEVASALAGRLELSSATPPIRGGVASLQAASSGLGVASAAMAITAASATPVAKAGVASAAAASVAAASGATPGMGVVSSAAVEAFASAVATRLGFASSVGQADILAVFASRVASALRNVTEFAGRPEVASSIAAVVASTVGARILASQAGGDLLAQRLTGVASSAAPLTRRPPLKD